MGVKEEIRQDVYTYFNAGVDKLIAEFRGCEEIYKGIERREEILSEKLQQLNDEKKSRQEENKNRLEELRTRRSELEHQRWESGQMHPEIKSIKYKIREIEEELSFEKQNDSRGDTNLSVEDRLRSFQAECYEEEADNYVASHYIEAESDPNYRENLARETADWLEDEFHKKGLNHMLTVCASDTWKTWEEIGEQCLYDNEKILLNIETGTEDAIDYYCQKCTKTGLANQKEVYAEGYVVEKYGVPDTTVKTLNIKLVIPVVIGFFTLLIVAFPFLVIGLLGGLLFLCVRNEDKAADSLFSVGSILKRIHQRYFWQYEERELTEREKEEYQSHLEEGRGGYDSFITVIDHEKQLREELVSRRAAIDQKVQLEKDRIETENREQMAELQKEFETNIWNAILREKKEEYRREEREYQERKANRKNRISQLEKNRELKENELHRAEEKVAQKEQSEKEIWEQNRQNEISACIAAEGKILDEIKLLDAEYEQRKAKEEEQCKKETEEQKEKFQKRKKELADQFQQNGMRDVCGFDYRKAWEWMYGLASNLRGKPNDPDFFDNECDDPENNTLKNMIAEATGEKKKLDLSAMEILPVHTIYGYEKHSVMRQVISESDIFNAFSRGEYKEDIIHDVKLPHDGFYKLKLADAFWKQALFLYDFGDLDDSENNQIRNRLGDFAMRACVYSMFRHIDNTQDFCCDIMSSDYGFGYIKGFQWAPDDSHMITYYDADKGIKRINEIYEQAECLGETMYQQCLKRAKNAQGAKKPYHVLLFLDPNIEKYERSKLKNLLDSVETKGNENEWGIYPCIFADLNKIRQKNSQSSSNYFGDLLKIFKEDIFVLEIPDDKQKEDFSQFMVKKITREEAGKRLENS